MVEGEREEAILITPDLIDDRVEFERGMPAFPWPTIALILSHVVLFGIQLARKALEDPAALIAVGALETGAVRAGAVWRFWSATFLHGSIDHLIGNALALYVTGMACEHAFGRPQFVVLYVVSGLSGSTLSFLTLAPGRPAVGASGAIFGLMGAAACLILKKSRQLHLRDKRVGLVLLAWILYTLAIGALTPFVDNFAHLGGLAGGIACSFVLWPVVLDRGTPLPPTSWLLLAMWGGVAGGLTIPWMRALLG